MKTAKAYRFRLPRNMRAADLVAGTELSKGFISLFLRGKRDLGLSTAAKLAEVLSMSLDQLHRKIQRAKGKGSPSTSTPL